VFVSFTPEPPENKRLEFKKSRPKGSVNFFGGK